MHLLWPWTVPKLGWRLVRTCIYGGYDHASLLVAGPPSCPQCPVAGALSSLLLCPALGLQLTPNNFWVDISVVGPEIS